MNLSYHNGISRISPWRAHLKSCIFGLAGILMVLASGCAPSREGKVTQFSTIDALMAGVYDGDFSCSQVMRRGDLGLGTFDCLDGEMVVVDGVIYQVTSDGKVRRAKGYVETPFAAVTRFRPDQFAESRGLMSMAAMERQLDRLCPNKNGIYAIRIRGEFPTMKTRSVAAQSKPYRKLVEVAKEQSVFALGLVRGTLVGFRFPTSFRGINVPGYHLHFVSDDRRSGGHVLDFVAAPGARIETSHCTRFEMVLPGDQSDFSRAALGSDRPADLDFVER
jgi:acetolactate decarboxylase